MKIAEKPLSLPGVLIRAARYPHCMRVIGLWLPVGIAAVAWVLWSGALGILEVAALVAFGWLTWTFLEYHLHRYAQHWEPDSPTLLAWREKVLPHINHHLKPDNPRAVVTRKQGFPVIVWLVALGLFSLVVPFPIVLTYLSGISIGYAIYELFHFACHQIEMAGRLPKRMKQHHLFHHYRDDSVNFGVTTRLWDWAFGTLYRPGRQGTAEQG